MFLWLASDDPGRSAEGAAARLLERGVVITPGSYLGPGGEGFARLALVPPLAACEQAAELIAEVLGSTA